MHEVQGASGGVSDKMQRNQAFLLGLSDRLRRLENPVAILGEAAETLGKHLGVNRAGYAEIEADGETFVIERDWTDGTVKHGTGRRALLSFGEAVIGQLRRGETQRISDHLTDPMVGPAQRPAFAEMSIAAAITVPLVKGGRFVAMMSLHQSRPRHWTDDEVRLVEEVAERTWATLERARAETRLRDSEAQLRLLTDHMAQLAWIADARGTVYWCNKRWHDYTDAAIDRLAGQGWVDFVRGDAQADLRARLAQALETGAPVELTAPLRRADGAYRSFLIRVLPERGPDGRVAHWLGTGTDITEQLETERHNAFLLALEDRLRPLRDPGALLYETSSAIGRHLGLHRAGYSEVDPHDDCFVVCHDWVSEPLWHAEGRYPLSSFGPDIIASLCRRETLVINDVAQDPRLPGAIGEAYAALGIAALITVPLVKDGRLVAIMTVNQAEPRAWSPGEIRLVAELAERTWAALERARVEISLHENQRRQAFLLDLGDRLRPEVDPQAIIAATNQALGEYLGALRVGYGEVDATGEWLTFTADWTNGVISNVGTFELAAFGAAIVGENRAGRTFAAADVTTDPRIGPDHVAAYTEWGVHAIVAVPLIKAGRFTAVLSVQSASPRGWTDAELRLIEDVAERTWATLERARAEAGLRESQTLLAAFMQNAPVGMYLKDEQGRYVMANAGMDRIFGRPATEALGHTATELFDGEVQASIAAQDVRALADGQAQVTEQHLPGTEDGSWTMVIRFPVDLAEQGRRIGGFAIDITEQKRAEAELARSREALYQSEKLTALGSLLAGVSHELNNPLSVVVGQSMMMEEEAADTPLAERSAKIRRAAERCAKIVQTFLAMARQKPPQRASVDVNAVVRGALDLTDYGLRTAGVAVTTTLASDLPPLNADADQLHQVIANLLINAQQALQEVDRTRLLTIATRAGRRSGMIEIEVADNGPGISAELRRRIFEPFFTTKPQGVGTGLGLSFSLGVIEAHGGTLELLDRDVGAAFLLTLPAAADLVSNVAPAEGAQPSSAGRGHALVVDDEPEIAEMLAELLERMGYRVRVAANGAEGKVQLRAHDFDLILSDLRMPDVDGPAFYAWIERERPEMRRRVGFVTGDTLGPSAVRFLARSGCPYLEKPFTPQTVRAFVDRVRAPITTEPAEA